MAATAVMLRRQLSQAHRFRHETLLNQSQRSWAWRSFSAKTDDSKPKGIPYSKLTVGIPKETYPLEKRVAATPEVSEEIGNKRTAIAYCLNLKLYFVVVVFSLSRA